MEVHKASLVQLIDGLAGLKNRNGRVVGDLFRDLRDRSGDLAKLPNNARSLSSVKQILLLDRYESLSQFYTDVYVVFKQVEEVVGKSSVIWRDATKMEAALEEAWEHDKTLPPLETIGLDPNFKSRIDVKRGEGTETPSRTSEPPSGYPSPAASGKLGNLQAASFKPALTAASSLFDTSAVISPMLGSITAASATPAPLSMPLTISTGSLPMSPLASGLLTANPASANVNNKYLQQPSTNTLHIPAAPLTSQNEPNIELPIVLPSSLLSKEGRTKLDSIQAKLLADIYIRSTTAKKRKRDDSASEDVESGWLLAKETGAEQKQFYLQLLSFLRAQKDPSTGRQLSASINALPSRDKFPQFYQSIKESHPPTLTSVEKHVRTNLVPDPSDFDAEMSTIFSNGRLWPSAGANSSDGEALPGFFGDVVSLQRIYNEITKNAGFVPGEPAAAADMASVSNGPGVAPLNKSDVGGSASRYIMDMPSNRLKMEEKSVLRSIHYKGEEYATGDFVHLYNPSHPRLPIIAQIFQCYRQKSTGQRFFTVNWYYRPSQTLHLASRTFYEQEVLKTSLYLDHKLEDLIERVCVMPLRDYVKGRYEYWHDEMPLYVVEHRYNCESGTFTRIKNWAHCVPEGTVDSSSLRAFVELVPSPSRIKSPFIRNPAVNGPGRLADPLQSEDEDQDECYTQLSQWSESAGQVTGYGRFIAQKQLSEPVRKQEEEDPDIKRNQRQKSASVKASQQDGNAEGGTNSPHNALEEVAAQESFKRLPPGITHLFRSDTRSGDVLWFPAPPMHVSVSRKAKTRHSLDYLAHRATELGY